MAYSIAFGDPFDKLEFVLGQSHWFSRGWTLQELIMSQRILVFTEDEAFFYCPKGLLTESMCLGNDGNESFEHYTSNKKIRLCNFLLEKNSPYRTRPISIRNTQKYYRAIYLTLLNTYLKRVLSFDSDILNAFSGILSAQEFVLGDFYWGLPLSLFAISLLINLRYAHDSRIGFPSWSWAGKRLVFSSRSVEKCIGPAGGFLDKEELKALVHIYTHDKQGQLQLLVGPRNDYSAFEGYCSSFIEAFNRYTLLEPLPVYPSLENDTCAAQSPTEMGSTLLFWTQTAYMTTVASWHVMKVAFDFPNPPERFEVILVAGTLWDDTTWGKEFTDGVNSLDRFFEQRLDHYYGIVIERQGEYARRIGVANYIARKDWVAANPRKELIMLI